MAINLKETLDLPSLLPPHDTPNGDHKCLVEICGKTFESLDDLTRHDSICHPYVGMARVNKHAEGAVLPCPCPIPGCSRTFETSFSVNSHIKQTHGIDPWKDPAGVQAMIARYNSLLQPNGNFPAVQAGSSSCSNGLQPNEYIPSVQAVSTRCFNLQPNGSSPGAQPVSASYTNNFQSTKNPGVFQSVSSNNSNSNRSPGPGLICYCPEPDCGKAFETPYSVGLHHKQVHRFRPYRKPRSVQGVNSTHSTQAASATSSPPNGFSQSIGQNGFLQSAPPGQPVNFDLHNFNPDTTESILRLKNDVRTKKESNEMDSVFPYQCHLCEVHDQDYQKYHMHMTQAHPNEGMLLKFRCFVEGCNRSFKQKGKRLSHVEVDHDGAKLKCPGCPSTYAGESGIWLHVRKEHSPVGEGHKYKCHYCTSSFVLPSDLKRHAGSMHGEWGCTYGNCEWYFGTAKELDNHWNEKHRRKAPVWLFDSRKVPKENPRQVPVHRRLGDMSVQKEPAPIPWSSIKSQNPSVDGLGSPINYIRTIRSTGGENSFMSGPSSSQNVSYGSLEPALPALPVRRENSEPVFYSDLGNSIKSESKLVPAELGINKYSEDGKIRFSHKDHQGHYVYQQYVDLEPNSIDSSMAMVGDTGDDCCPATPPYKEKRISIDPAFLNTTQFPTASSHVPRPGVPGGMDVDGRQCALETFALPERGQEASPSTMPPSDILKNGFDGNNSQKGLFPVHAPKSAKKPRLFGATDFANLPLEEKKVDINEWFQKATAKCAPEDMRYYSPELYNDDESVVEETEHCGETYWTEDGRRALETLKSDLDGSQTPFYPRSVESSPKPPSAYTLSRLALPHPPKIVSPEPPARPQNLQDPLKTFKTSTSKSTTMSSNAKNNRDLKPSEHHTEPTRFVAGTTIPGLQPRGRGRPRKREHEETTAPAGQPVSK